MSLLIEHKKKLTKKNVVKFAECEVFGEAQQLMSYSEMEKTSIISICFMTTTY